MPQEKPLEDLPKSVELNLEVDKEQAKKIRKSLKTEKVKITLKDAKLEGGSLKFAAYNWGD